MKSSVLSAIEVRFYYYQRKYRNRPVSKASSYARNWAYGIYRWTFGEEPPNNWKSQVEDKLRELEKSKLQEVLLERKLDEFTG